MAPPIVHHTRIYQRIRFGFVKSYISHICMRRSRVSANTKTNRQKNKLYHVVITHTHTHVGPSCRARSLSMMQHLCITLIDNIFLNINDIARALSCYESCECVYEWKKYPKKKTRWKKKESNPSARVCVCTSSGCVIYKGAATHTYI